MRNNRNWDLYIVAAWVVAVLALNQLALPVWAKVALTLPLVVGLTGYAITAAIFAQQQLGKAERLLFVICLSFATSAIGGLILNLTNVGLRRGSWLIYLCVVALSAGVVALVRRIRVVPVAVALAPSHSLWLRPSPRQLAHGALFACAGLIALAAIMVARTPPTPAEGLQGYTLLWMLPPNTGKNTDAKIARVGVHCVEFVPTQYRLQLQQDGAVLREWSLFLQPGEQWESNTLAGLNQQNAPNTPIQALLYRTDLPNVAYRQVAFWPNKPAPDQKLEAL